MEAEPVADGAEVSDMTVDCKGDEPFCLKLARSERTEGWVGGERALPVMDPRSQDPVEASDKFDNAARLGPIGRGEEEAELDVFRGGIEVGLEGWDML